VQSVLDDIMPSWREYPYGAGGVFELDTLTWDKDVLVIDLGRDHTRLPTAYEHATGQSFWGEVRRSVLTACAGSKERPHIADRDYDLYFALGTKDDASFERQAIKVKEVLEQRAKQIWLRPGVPKLNSLVISFLSSRANLVMSLLEYQRKNGYSDTRQLVDQFSKYLLSD
jgi:hypothetical protein